MKAIKSLRGTSLHPKHELSHWYMEHRAAELGPLDLIIAAGLGVVSLKDKELPEPLKVKAASNRS